MSVLRWQISDPHDPSPATNSYTFVRNPASMTSVYPERAITSMTTTFGKVLLFEGSTPPKQFTFAGPILEKAHFDALRSWCYTHTNRNIIRDHYGRLITCVLTGVEMVPVRRVNYYYSHDYTVTALITSITEPTITNAGYIA